MSGPYIDLYAWCPQRSAAAARRFLDGWAPQRMLSTDELAFPAFSDTAEVLASVDDLLERLEHAPCESYRLYWRSGRRDEIEHVVLAFTSDGGMIAGLSVADWHRPRPQIAAILERLASSVGARHGYAAAEEPPVDREADMIVECGRREVAWIDGIVDRRKRPEA